MAGLLVLCAAAVPTPTPVAAERWLFSGDAGRAVWFRRKDSPGDGRRFGDGRRPAQLVSTIGVRTADRVGVV